MVGDRLYSTWSSLSASLRSRPAAEVLYVVKGVLQQVRADSGTLPSKQVPTLLGEEEEEESALRWRAGVSEEGLAVVVTATADCGVCLAASLLVMLPISAGRSAWRSRLEASWNELVPDHLGRRPLLIYSLMHYGSPVLRAPLTESKHSNDNGIERMLTEDPRR